LSGFWWADYVELDQWRIGEPGLLYDHGATRRSYEPLREETALFLTLAHTDPKPDAILAFANRYGSLGSGVEAHRIFEFEQDGSKRPVQIEIETLSAWQTAIRLLHHLVILWQLARAGDRKRLEQFIVWEKERLVTRHTPPIGKVPISPSYYVQNANIEAGDTIGAAFVVVQAHLNEALRGLVSPWLYWDSAGRQPAFSFQVPSLWAGILLQFAEAVGGQHNYQRCAACSHWFKLAPGVNRANRLTCSDSCRQRFYRLRQERAIELHEQGKTPREIAKELGSDTATIKGWISKRKER
jgi:hypothetical protein